MIYSEQQIYEAQLLREGAESSEVMIHSSTKRECRQRWNRVIECINNKARGDGIFKFVFKITKLILQKNSIKTEVDTSCNLQAG